MTTYALRHGVEPSYESAEEMYRSMAAWLTVYEDDEERQIPMQVVPYAWLDDADEAALIDRVYEVVPHITPDDARDLVALARRVREDIERVEGYLADACRAYSTGDLTGVLEALRAASDHETDYGDDPATAELRAQLLEED